MRAGRLLVSRLGQGGAAMKLTSLSNVGQTISDSQTLSRALFARIEGMWC